MGDREGCKYDPASAEVATPTGFKAAYSTMVQSGWAALSVAPEWGGQGLPLVLNVAFNRDGVFRQHRPSPCIRA